jgi:hypothetical protein
VPTRCGRTKGCDTVTAARGASTQLWQHGHATAAHGVATRPRGEATAARGASTRACDLATAWRVYTSQITEESKASGLKALALMESIHLCKMR